MAETGLVRRFVDRLAMVTRVLPFIPARGSARERAMFPAEPVERHDEPATPVPGGAAREDQQHVDAAHRLEHGHPKR